MIVGGYQMFINGSQWLVIRFLVTNGDYYYRSMRPALKKYFGVGPGSGRFFQNNSYFYNNFYVDVG